MLKIVEQIAFIIIYKSEFNKFLLKQHFGFFVMEITETDILFMGFCYLISVVIHVSSI